MTTATLARRGQGPRSRPRSSAPVPKCSCGPGPSVDLPVRPECRTAQGPSKRPVRSRTSGPGGENVAVASETAVANRTTSPVSAQVPIGHRPPGVSHGHSSSGHQTGPGPGAVVDRHRRCRNHPVATHQVEVEAHPDWPAAPASRPPPPTTALASPGTGSSTRARPAPPRGRRRR